MQSDSTSAAVQSGGIYPGGFVIDLESLDLDQMSALAGSAQWQLEQYQWGRGRFEAALRAFHTPTLQLGLSVRSTGALIRGNIPRGSLMLGLPLRADAELRMHGAAAKPTEMLALRHGDELEVSTRHASVVLSVAIGEDILQRYFRAILGEPLEHWRRDERLTLNHPGLSAVLARFLTQCVEVGIDGAYRRDFRLLQSLENTIIEALVRPVGIPPIQSSRAGRWHQAGKAEEYLRAHTEQPLSLPDLCTAVGVNERTLFLGFGERYGISPKAYLKQLRLNLARRDLLNAEPGTRVTDVATRFCFFQFGQFSMEYHALFGEYPRDTLGKSLRLKPGVPGADNGPPVEIGADRNSGGVSPGFRRRRGRLPNSSRP